MTHLACNFCRYETFLQILSSPSQDNIKLLLANSHTSTLMRRALTRTELEFVPPPSTSTLTHAHTRQVGMCVSGLPLGVATYLVHSVLPLLAPVKVDHPTILIPTMPCYHPSLWPLIGCGEMKAITLYPDLFVNGCVFYVLR